MLPAAWVLKEVHTTKKACNLQKWMLRTIFSTGVAFADHKLGIGLAVHFNLYYFPILCIFSQLLTKFVCTINPMVLKVMWEFHSVDAEEEEQCLRRGSSKTCTLRHLF